MQVIAAHGALVVINHREGDMLHIEGEAVAEDQHQGRRHHEGQREKQPVAQNLAPLLARQRDDATDLHVDAS